jgi:hypothetical protein
MIIERVRNDGTVKRDHVILFPIKSIRIVPSYNTIHNLTGIGYNVNLQIFYKDIPCKSFGYSSKEWENQGGEA